MGRLVAHHTVVYHLELSGEDLMKQEERHHRKNEFPTPTKGQIAFCERLPSCPLCGQKPYPLIVGEYGNYKIKMSCKGNPFHISEGDWKKGFAKAGKEWIKRTHDKPQVERGLAEKSRWDHWRE